MFSLEVPRIGDSWWVLVVGFSLNALSVLHIPLRWAHRTWFIFNGGVATVEMPKPTLHNPLIQNTLSLQFKYFSGMNHSIKSVSISL